MEKVILNSRQLDQLAQHHPTLAPYYRGALPCDDLPNVQDTLLPFGFIVNTDPSTMEGRHWIGVWVSSPSKVEWYDSFALDLPLYETTQPLQRWLYQFKHAVRNGQAAQSVYDQSCGGYALMFLVAKSQDVSMTAFQLRFHKHDYVDNDQQVARFVHNLILKECRWMSEADMQYADTVDGPTPKIQTTFRSRNGVRHLLNNVATSYYQ